MDSKRLDDLLNKYWNCETSLEEEEQLREYFRYGNVPEAHKETALLFQYFELQKNGVLKDSAFEDKVLDQVHPPKKGRVVKWFHNSMRIAAGITVVMVATWFIRNEIRETTPPEMVDTYDDPRLAFEETKKALLMISKSFGTAEEQAKKINLFNEAQENVKGDEEVKTDPDNN